MQGKDSYAVVVSTVLHSVMSSIQICPPGLFVQNQQSPIHLVLGISVLGPEIFS